MNGTDVDIVAEVTALVDALRLVLAGNPPMVQGAALADAVALWLAGHHVPGDADATRSLRTDILATHCTTVRRLVPHNARAIGTTP